MRESETKGRAKKADVIARKRLAEQRKTGQNTLPAEFFADLQRILVSFLEDRLEAQIAGDTMSDLRARLLSRGFSPKAADDVITEMESCDFARFAASAGQEKEKEQALARLEALIQELAKTRVLPSPKEKR